MIVPLGNTFALLGSFHFAFSIYFLFVFGHDLDDWSTFGSAWHELQFVLLSGFPADPEDLPSDMQALWKFSMLVYTLLGGLH